MTTTELHNLQNACNQLLSQQKTLLLASRNQVGNPDISYAPYHYHDFKFYIFVSDLAKHSQNLRSHPQASIMFIEPEAQASNPFARQRLSFDCRVQEISQTDLVFSKVLHAMTAEFGEIVSLLRQLPDFHLFALTPTHGQFIAGFGKAFVVDAEAQVQLPTGAP
ncbi:pyridoxamine 5-phosphate oxidase [Methylomonas lenta]|uniref:Pyridoxamine 5-phosphate oxidase n=1 Tax=Methylomonas lenta TaxID=980561 RepID=A0A177NBL9_9GAMM|nr:pyridoxamine 5'-phosphate oxidase family protein [Methylomonas lenta]OAI15438.1 pyridoxamine 5-phosphate oxidase [Methylomonas lenta]